MALPLKPPVLPQLARSAKTLPTGDGWVYEPKWDGFRAIAFVDGDDVYLQSRNGKPLRRYFPELELPGRPLRARRRDRPVRRPRAGRTSTRSASASTRPSRASRCSPSRRRRASSPSTCSPHGDESLLELPQAERRDRLEELVDEAGRPHARDRATPTSAEPWLQGAEGVIAKRQDAPYRPASATGMVKIKRVRTIDAVVMGWRPGKEEGTVGSLILGLYDDDGRLRPVGHTSGFSAKEKRELPAELAPYETGERGMGDPSRWANDRELEWIELRPELVVEVTFDHTSNDRIRHGAKIARWRDDKDPRDCTLVKPSCSSSFRPEECKPGKGGSCSSTVWSSITTRHCCGRCAAERRR